MKLGFARKDITPDFPVPMAGYYANRISKGVHDKLYVRVLFFVDKKNRPLAIIQLDLLSLDRICMEKIYAALKIGITDYAPLSKNNILICAAHTHSGFGGIFDTEHGINRELIPLYGEYNPRLVEFLVERCVKAVVAAAKNCVETTVRVNKGTIDGLGSNRRNRDIPCDNSIFIMEFFRMDGKKILLYNLCCHPTVLNKENLLISADFPGTVAEKLEEASGAYDMVVFINGSSGDMSTRFTRQENSFNECNRYAKMIVEAIDKLKYGVFLPLEKAGLQYQSLLMLKALPPDPKKTRSNLQNAIEHLRELKNQNADTAAIRKAASLVEGAQISLLKSSSELDEESPRHKTVEFGVLRINTSVIICSPFELFSTLALVLKERKKVECFGYINCLEGYLADCDAWDNLDYEALSSEFQRGEGERYIDSICELI